MEKQSTKNNEKSKNKFFFGVKESSKTRVDAVHKSCFMLKNLYNCFRAKRCFIVENTSGLSKTDWALLNTQTTFSLDDTYRYFVKNKVAPSFHVCSDKSVFDFDPSVVSSIPCERFMPINNFDKITNKQDCCFLYTRDRSSGKFMRELTAGATYRQRALFIALELAYFMGFSQVFLVGVGVPLTASRSRKKKAKIRSEFCSTASGKIGQRRHRSFENEFEKDMKSAKVAFETNGRILVDATPFGQMTLLPKTKIAKIAEMDHQIGVKVKACFQANAPIIEPVEYPYLVTAIVSTYNAERFVGGCLEDLERQSIADQLEIIVVISGSQQSEEKIVNEFCQKYNNIRFIKTSVRETVYQAWNRAIKMARGRYLTNANTDDRHRPDAFEKMVAVLEEDPSTALVYIDQKYFKETDNQSKEFMFDRDRGPFSRTRLLNECFVGSQPMWRASVHKEYGYFDEAFFTAGDYEFWLRIAQSYQFVHLRELLGERLIRNDSLEYDGNSQLSYFESAIIRKCYEYAETYRIPINQLGLSRHPLFSNWCELNLIQTNTLSKISAGESDLRLAARKVHDNRPTGGTPRLSVVITTFNRKEDLLLNLRSLNLQTCIQFEAIIVNNGASISELANGQLELAYPYCYLENPSNYGPSHARNLGVRNARSDIVAILDDDAIADPGWVCAITKHFREESISGLRGKVNPKTLQEPVHIPANYDLGDEVIYNTAGLEMNTAFRRELFLKLGGYDEFMFGFEGAELSYRIFMACGQKVECIKYYPDVKIFHDFPDNPERLFETQLRLKAMKQLADKKMPGYSNYVSIMWGRIPANQKEDSYSRLIENAIFCLQGSPQEAASFAAKAIAINQVEPLGFVLNGSALLKMSDFGNARKSFETALQLIDYLLKHSSMEPEITKSQLQLRSLSQQSLAQCLEKEGDFEKAQLVRDQAKKAISIDAPPPRLAKPAHDPVLRSQDRLDRYQRRHWGQRCVIIGNGPSLNKMNLSFLENEVSFGMNRIYLMFDKWNLRPTYYVSVNPLVLEQSAKEILKIKAPKFISHKGIPFFPQPPNDLMFIRSLPDWVFSTDPRNGLCEGWTVTYFAMQLAYYMGFEEVVLIGVDHHFVTKGDPNKLVVSEGDDPNHFHPGYFGKGVRWHLPDLERSEISYRMAKEAFERDGRRILDATVDGRLTVFPKVDYRQHFKAPCNPPAFGSKPTSDRMLTPLHLAQELVASGKLNEAAALLEQAIAAQPQDASLHFARGSLHERCGAPDRAVAFFETAARLAPENTTYLYSLALRYHDICGRSIEALGLLRQSFEQNSNDPSIHQLIGEILHSIGRVDEASYFKETAERLISEGRSPSVPIHASGGLRTFSEGCPAGS